MQENKIINFFIKNKLICSILLLTFFVSISYSFYYKIEPMVDARAYDVIAQNIINGYGYKEILDPEVKYEPSLVRAGPVYEYFLAGIYKVFGHNYTAVWVIQAILHSISALLIYLTCLLIFNNDNKEKIGLVAASMLGLYPDLIEISAMLMTETLYIFLVCLSIYLFFYYFKNNQLITLVALSVAFGLAVLTRPPVAFLLPVLIIYFFEKKQFLRSIIFIMLVVLVLTPWTVRNYYLYGKAMPFGAGGAYNFWIGNHIGASGEQDPGPQLTEYFNSHNVIESYDESVYQFKNFVVNYPQEFIKLTLMRVNKYFSTLRPMGFWFYNSGVEQALFVISSAIFSFFTITLGIGGFLSFLKKQDKNPKIRYLAYFTVATPLIIFITVVETRYRFQIYPFLSLFAAYFIFEIKENSMEYKTLAISFCVVLFNASLDLLINYDSFKEKIISKIL